MGYPIESTLLLRGHFEVSHPFRFLSRPLWCCVLSFSRFPCVPSVFLSFVLFHAGIRTNLSNAALDISGILGNPLPQNDPNQNLREELVRELEEGRESSIATSSMLLMRFLHL